VRVGRLAAQAAAQRFGRKTAAEQRVGPLVAASLLDRITTGHLHVGTSIVAVTERLGVQKVLTLDRRHVGPIRPRHCAALEILP